jgi:hypothetical protein
MKAWRDVTKQLPITDAQVLAYSVSEGYLILTYDEDGWVDHQFRFVTDVMYWMPIPVTPNE